MSNATPLANRRILIIDDNAAIHSDFRKVLGAQAEHSAQAALDVLEASLFGDAATIATRPNFEIDSAHQGEEGVAMVSQALRDGRCYSMAFVDMRMPPGWDGLKTIERLWATDPDVQIVICSAHTDYDWTEVGQRLGHSDKLLVLRKPAEPIEVLQCATALSRKWENDRLVRDHVLRLEEVITTRTRGLEAANLQLRHLATHDVLTGLPNRVLLDDRLQQAIAHADRDMRSFASPCIRITVRPARRSWPTRTPPCIPPSSAAAATSGITSQACMRAVKTQCSLRAICTMPSR